MDFRSVACPFCSLHCDDLHLQNDGGHWQLISPACPLASRRFRGWQPFTKEIPSYLFQKIRKLLQKAQQPLIVLSGDIEQEAVSTAINLARATSAFLVRDNYGNSDNFSSAMRTTGLLSATLGELRERADQVVILGDDPEKFIPRFWEFIGIKKKEKTVRLSSRQALESIRQLRLSNRSLVSKPDADITQASDRISKARSGVVFLNNDFLCEDANALTETLLWLKELGDAKKWYGQLLSPSANENGISQALMSVTGFSGGLSFRKGFPLHDSRMSQLGKIMANHEADVLVAIGGLPHYHNLILKKLDEIKTIIISPKKPEVPADVWVPCAQVGIDAPGIMLRLDGVPVRFALLVESGQTTAEEYLLQFAQEIKA